MFEIGKSYTDRSGNEYTCVKPLFGSLPEFEREGKRYVRARDGKYRFDDKTTDMDIMETK